MDRDDKVTRLRRSATLADRYRIDRELGAGGMATVYLAHDLRHDRDVAIKVLHPELAAALGGDRFLSEIKTTAKLQHPHILPLLDSGDADGLLFYVMPFVTGETLRARLERERQLPIADALRIAREVADALGSAHALGIIHRDIKPENILLQGGHALVADFGIALAVQHAGGARMTQTGLSLGTPQYMSPEQAMGEKTIDARSDLYALGAVSYEMLVGEPPFTGPTVQAIVARLVTEEPRSLSQQRKAIPAGVEAAVMKALEKLPADRFTAASDFVAALGSDGPAAQPATAGTNRGGLLVAVVAMVAVSVAAGWLLGRRRTEANPQAAATATRFAIETRPAERLPSALAKMFVISPDGSTLVYVATLDGGQPQLMRRRLDELDAIPIPGTAGALDPVFSPDGRWIAFFSGGQLVKVPLGGGTPIRLAAITIGNSRGLAWSSTGELVFATNISKTLFAVPEGGGQVRSVFPSAGSAGPRWPVTIPGSDRVLFSTFSSAADTVAVMSGSLADGKAAPVGNEVYTAIGVLDDRLLYLTRLGDLVAAPFDTRRGVTTGLGVRIVSGVLMNTGVGFGQAVLSASGDLVYRDGSTASQLLLVGPNGATRPAAADTAGFENPRFSPDGRRVVVSVDRSNWKTLWIMDRVSGILSRLTEDEVGTSRDRPEWTPDGRGLVYRLITPVGNAMASRAADGSGGEARMPTPRVSVNEVVVHPDGTTLLGRASSGGTGSQDLMWWTTSDTTPHVYAEGPELESGARFSPDGRWVAYTAELAGSREVFVSPFPGPGGRVQVSRSGTGLPVWGRDGRTLYYPKGTSLLAATLSLSSPVTVTETRVVFEGDYAFDDPLHAAFDVGPDGTMLVVHPVRGARTIVIRDFGAEIRNQLAKQGSR